jgi:dTMP kinase
MANLITFEGIDGSGKGTQAKAIKEYLEKKGFEATIYHQPSSSTESGKTLNEVLKTHNSQKFSPKEIADLYIDDGKFVSKQAEKDITNERFPILDRHRWSTCAYQGAQGVKLGYIITESRFGQIDGTIIPTVTFLLDGPAEVLLERVKDRGNDLEYFEKKVDFLEQVRQNYLKLPSMFSILQPKRKSYVIDATKSIPEVTKDIYLILEDNL